MGVLWISSSSQDEPNHPYRCFLWQCCAISRGGGKEAQVVFREHKRDNLNPADGVRLLRVLVNSGHLLREEEENHLLGWDGTSRSSSAFHLHEVEGESVASSKVGESREGRFLLYWITTTSTSFTTTFSVSSALCTPAGAGICG